MRTGYPCARVRNRDPAVPRFDSLSNRCLDGPYAGKEPFAVPVAVIVAIEVPRVVTSPSGAVVANVSGALSGGNVQSKRIRH